MGQRGRPSLSEMANAVAELVELKRDHLRGLEELSYHMGFEPGPDLAFAGIRLAVARGEAAVTFLRALCPHETAARALADGCQAAV